VSEIPGIDHARVSRFLVEHVPGAREPLEFSLISGGRSNLTYRVQSDDRSFALRRPPLGHRIATAHDMRREYRVQRALAGGPVPVATPLALCEDPKVLDVPFYVMEFRDGVVLQDRVPAGFLRGAEDGRRVSQALVDTLATLHAVDFRAVGLEDFGRPDGYLTRQVERWAKQWEANRTAPLPEIDALLARLGRSLPAQQDATLVHGDYRLGNMSLAKDDPGRVIAVFDWEMATLGDPLADLGYTLIYWVEAGEQSAGGVETTAVSAQPGFMTRAEIVEAYSKSSGRDVSSIDWYQVLALTKLAVISEGILKRFQMGKTAGAGFEKMNRAAEPLARRALEIADASFDQRLRTS
jgi:aminoglycoside phosphotransferase (APT) family kinase protein